MRKETHGCISYGYASSSSTESQGPNLQHLHPSTWPCELLEDPKTADISANAPICLHVNVQGVSKHCTRFELRQAQNASVAALCGINVEVVQPEMRTLASGQRLRTAQLERRWKSKQTHTAPGVPSRAVPNSSLDSTSAGTVRLVMSGSRMGVPDASHLAF